MISRVFSLVPMRSHLWFSGGGKDYLTLIKILLILRHSNSLKDVLQLLLNGWHTIYIIHLSCLLVSNNTGNSERGARVCV
jgi:hypothetical protein